MSALPLNITATGPVATPPATLQAALIAGVAATVPGYTANLPGSLIEDISSTDVGAMVTIDQARVDAVNSISPYAANPYILAQMGVQFGIPQGVAANGNAYVVFTGTPGYVIAPGFAVSDGTYQYVVQDGGTIAANGSSQPLYVVASQSGTFPIATNTITTVITSVPSPYTLTVTNPTAGVPGTATTETTESYRSRILQASLVAMTGTAAYLKTLLQALPGVSTRLVSVLQNGIYWEVICGGGDPYQTAGAIYQSGMIPGLLTGSNQIARNVNVSIYEAPDIYNIVFVNPPQQTTTVAVKWHTSLSNFTAGAAVNQYIVAATQAYINTIVVGQPINLMVLQQQIAVAVSPVLNPINLTALLVTVTVNGTVMSPTAGTSIIPSDYESFFYCSPSGVTSVQV